MARGPPPGTGWGGSHCPGDGCRIGGEVHSMVWDPTGERLAVIIRGTRGLLPPQCPPPTPNPLGLAGRRGTNPPWVRGDAPSPLPVA